MKIRKGFVSNSSSSSFTILRDNLTSLQVTLIEKYLDVAPFLMQCPKDIKSIEEWDIKTEGGYLKGYTYMDNFDMGEYLTVLGIPEHLIKWTID